MEYWRYDGARHYKVGLNGGGAAARGGELRPSRFDEMRRGAWDIDARVHDMDLNGVYASLNFPSSLAGFAGQRYQLGVSDPELALAVVRAANDWHLDEWAGRHPGRIIPCQVPRLLDADVAAREIRANGGRVSGPSQPPGPSVSAWRRCTGWWDPFLAACAETGTVVCLHTGSSSSAPVTSSDAVRHHRRAVLRMVDVRGGRLAVLACAGAVPRSCASVCRRWHRLGRRPPRPTRPRRALPADVRHVDGHRADSGRGPAAQFLVLRDRGPLRARRATTASASTTSASKPTIRTRTARGPTPRRSCTRRSGGSPTTGANSRETRPGSSPSPCRRPCRPAGAF